MTQPQSEYFIEKAQLPVEITLVAGGGLAGLLFVHPSWRPPSLEFDAPSILNGQDPFFPVQLHDGRTQLVAKSHVVSLRGNAAETGNGPDVPGDPVNVSIACTNGDSVTGRLMMPRIAPNARLLDFLNRSPDEFITVHTPGATVLLNRRHITLVTDETDGTA